MAHEIIALKAEEHDNLMYLIADRSTAEAAVVDPAWDAEGIREVLNEEALHLTAILITHAHHDHINAVEALLSPEVTVFVHAAEAVRWRFPEAHICIQDGDEIQLGSAFIQVLHTPGHTMGSCCFRSGEALLTGDTLFVYGCGHTRDGSAEALYHSLKKIKNLPPSTRIYPGHDYGVQEHSSLAEQCAGNPFLMLENQADFLRYRLEIASKTRHTPYAAMQPHDLKQALQIG